MSDLATQDFDTLVENSVTAVQGRASSLVDLSVGSILRSVLEAFAGVVLWLQGLILQVLALTRFASSSGDDADSWAADYGFTRLPATTATGQVTFARFTATSNAQIPVGTIVETADGTEQFVVVADTTQSAYITTLAAYVIAPGTASCSATVQAAAAGAAGNASAGAVTTLTSAIPGVDTVTNATAFANGADSETDTAMRLRFQSWIASLSKATAATIRNAVLNLQQNMSAEVVENELYDGTTQRGAFYVVVDDGTGAPSSTILASAATAIDAVRPVGSVFAVYAPVIVTADVAMTIATAGGYAHADVLSAVSTAMASYINGLGLGAALPFSRLAQVAYDASDGVANVAAITLNGGSADLAVTAQQVIKAGTISLT